MKCYNPIKHKIQENETLYLLARYYKTSVVDILSMNPGLDPYNLPIGAIINICTGADYIPDKSIGLCDDSTKTTLIKDMRLAWSQHIYWTYLALVSITENLNDIDPTINRLLENPDDLFNLYIKFYPKQQAAIIKNLLTEHLQLGGQIITAMSKNQSTAINQLNIKWYKNADKLSRAFGDICPYYNDKAVQKMFYMHLAYITDMATYRLSQNYSAAITVFNKSEKEMMQMADYFSCGIIKQFPHKF